MLKQLLRKTLGRASLNYEELMTVICDCEAVINARPLTYVSEDTNDLDTLTPSVFLSEPKEYRLPDCDMIENVSLNRKIRKLQSLREILCRRFRVEYLGQLRIMTEKKANSSVPVGDVVLIGDDKSKRIDWPIGRISEVIPGKDGRVRVVRVATNKGLILRPLQRIYHLECCDDRKQEVEKKKKEENVSREEISSVSENINIAGVRDDKNINSRVPVLPQIVTRSGRVIKKPRY